MPLIFNLASNMQIYVKTNMYIFCIPTYMSKKKDRGTSRPEYILSFVV